MLRWKQQLLHGDKEWSCNSEVERASMVLRRGLCWCDCVGVTVLV